MKRTLNITLALLIMAAVLGMSSCGYFLRPKPAHKKINLGNIDNRTHEPSLGDQLRVSLTRELMARGIHLRNGSDTTLSGTVESLEITPLAERAGVTVKYSVSARGLFRLEGTGDKDIHIRLPLRYIIDFGSNVPLDSLYAMRELAVKRAIEDMAADIAASVAAGR